MAEWPARLAITLARRQLKGGAEGRCRPGPGADRGTPSRHCERAIQTYVQRTVPDGQVLNRGRSSCSKAARETTSRSRSGQPGGFEDRGAAAGAGRAGRDPLDAEKHSKAVYVGSGHNLILTQRALGHRAITTTSRYLESTDEEVADAVFGISGPLAPLSPLAQPSSDLPRPRAIG